MARVFARAARRAKLPLRYTQGYHPHPRIIFGPALPVGVESLAEYVDIELLDIISIETMKTRLNQELPPGITILSGEEISLKTPAISDSLYEICYSIPSEKQSIFRKFSSEGIKRVIQDFLCQPSFPISKPRKGELKTFDIRLPVKNIIFSDSKTFELTLQFPQAQSIRPTEIIGTILGVSESNLQNLPICKTSMKLKE